MTLSNAGLLLLAGVISWLMLEVAVTVAVVKAILGTGRKIFCHLTGNGIMGEGTTGLLMKLPAATLLKLRK